MGFRGLEVFIYCPVVRCIELFYHVLCVLFDQRQDFICGCTSQMSIPLSISRLGVACDTVSSDVERLYQVGRYSIIISCGVYCEAM